MMAVICEKCLQHDEARAYAVHGWTLILCQLCYAKLRHWLLDWQPRGLYEPNGTPWRNRDALILRFNALVGTPEDAEELAKQQELLHRDILEWLEAGPKVSKPAWHAAVGEPVPTAMQRELLHRDILEWLDVGPKVSKPAWAEIVGWLTTCIAIAGVVLNNARRRQCFLLWMVSNAVSCCLHVAAGMWALSARDAVFFALSVAGWYQWRTPAAEAPAIDEWKASKMRTSRKKA